MCWPVPAASEQATYINPVLTDSDLETESENGSNERDEEEEEREKWHDDLDMGFGD